MRIEKLNYSHDNCVFFVLIILQGTRKIIHKMFLFVHGSFTETLIG